MSGLASFLSEMNMLKQWIERLAPHTALLLGLASIAILGTAYTFQHFGYEPCTLCYYQRYPYMAVVLFSGLALLLSHSKGGPDHLVLLLVGASIAALFLDTGIAAFHVGVEQKWWEGLSTCGGGSASSGSVEDLLQQMQRIKLVRCDEPAWTLFGISMAGYNVALTLGLGIFGLLAWPHLKQKAKSQ